MLTDQEEMVRLTGHVDDQYLDEAAGYQPKRSFWRSALGIVVRRLIELLIIMFIIFALLSVAEKSYEDSKKDQMIDESFYKESVTVVP